MKDKIQIFLMIYLYLPRFDLVSLHNIIVRSQIIALIIYEKALDDCSSHLSRLSTQKCAKFFPVQNAFDNLMSSSKVQLSLHLNNVWVFKLNNLFN